MFQNSNKVEKKNDLTIPEIQSQTLKKHIHTQFKCNRAAFATVQHFTYSSLCRCQIK